MKRGQRLDTALVSRGLVASRERAQTMVLGGRVKVAGVLERRPDRHVSETEAVEVEVGEAWASRGALKLAPALAKFEIAPTGRTCADIGASNGGFTDLLLRQGADLVYAVDVGRGLLDWRLRQDPRVVVMERTNARSLTGFPKPVTLVVMDLSFIGLEKVLPALSIAAPAAEVVALYKPQFQLGREHVGSGGIVRDEEATARGLDAFAQAAPTMGYEYLDRVPAGLRGGDGNQEWFVHLVPVAARVR